MTETSPKEGSKDSGGVDLQALISDFLADEEKSSLELPANLTADQRKEAKRLIALHPELNHRSFGLGEDRQLHIFKKEEKVRVKNTFIDGWEDGAGAGAEAPAFRSMPGGINIPVDLLERTLARCMESKAEVPREESSGTGSPRSTTTSGLEVSNADATPSSSWKDPSSMPDGLKAQVRNTFIHIESLPVVERVVQSMPHGMFRQCLEAELSAQQLGSDIGAAVSAALASANALPEAPREPAPTVLAPGGPSLGPPMAPPTLSQAMSPPPAAAATAVLGTTPPVSGGSSYSSAVPSRVAPAVAPAGERALVPGTEVIIQNLVKLPDFNGLTGVVQSLDADSGRYDVLLDGPAGQCGWRWVKVKGENCRLKMPPPPRNAPTLTMDYMDGASQQEKDAASGSTSVPPTPKWEEDYNLQARGGLHRPQGA